MVPDMTPRVLGPQEVAIVVPAPDEVVDRSVCLGPGHRHDDLVYDLDGYGAEAALTSGFDPDDPQHSYGSDLVRYAIAMAQARARRDYGAFDALLAYALRHGYRVDAARDSVRVVYETREGRRLRRRAKDTHRRARRPAQGN